MERDIFYPEETLVEKVQSGEYGWKDYVCHHSPEWKREYESHCLKSGLPMNDETAWEFTEMKQKQLEQAIADGDA